MPVATQAGVFGIGALPSSGPGPSSGSRSRGGMPSSVQSVSLACPSCDLQRGDGRAGLLQDGPRLLHVKPGRGADPEFRLGEGQDSLLDPDVVPRDLDALLGDPILHVVRGDVRQQGHQGCVIVLHRSIQAGIGRLDVPADAAPQVEFPAQVEAVHTSWRTQPTVDSVGTNRESAR